MRNQRIDLAYWPAELQSQRSLCAVPANNGVNASVKDPKVSKPSTSIPTYLLCIVFLYNTVLGTLIFYANDMTFRVTNHNFSSQL